LQFTLLRSDVAQGTDEALVTRTRRPTTPAPRDIGIRYSIRWAGTRPWSSPSRITRMAPEGERGLARCV